MRRWSLSNRLLAYLILTQVLAFAAGWAITLFFDHFTLDGMSITTFDSYAVTRARALVLASLKPDGKGFVNIEPSAALQAEMARNPDLRFAVFDPGRKLVADGSSPKLVNDFASLTRFQSRWVEFTLPRAEGGGLEGHIEQKQTFAGPLQIFVYGYKARWEDLITNFVEQSRGHLPYLITPLALSISVMFFVVRKGLRPLNSFAESVSKIDLDSLDQRLPERDYPSELTPLVTATNGTLERLDAGAKALRRFTANAAHELRTPVSILTARLDAPDDPSLRTDLKRDARRIRNIVEQLLAIARIGGRSTAEWGSVDLVEVTKTLVSDALLLAYRAGRQIELAAPEKPVLVQGDRRAIESVLSNLVENAVRAEPIGGKVLISLGEDATVSIADHGEGIPERDRTLAFEPFWRKKSVGAGSGLGLAIAKELMEQHEGRIWIEETPGGGATFKVAFSRRDWST